MRKHGILAAALAAGVLAAPASAQDDSRSRDRGHPDARLRAMDADHDGVVTRAEWRGSDEAFRLQDANGDGVISGAEMNRPLDRETATRFRDDLVAAFTRADRDNDQRLGRGEWETALGSFDDADANHDGVVTRAEFLAARSGEEGGLTAAGERSAEARRRAAPGYLAGFDKGLVDGRQAGKEDKEINGGKWDLEGQRELEQADAGYQPSVGARADYQSGYRAGFRRGYREGFGPR